MVKGFLIGSIGVIAETSELQRQAYNYSFELNNLEWYWNTGTYCHLLLNPGGEKRIMDFSKGSLSKEKIKKIHKDKQEIFEELVQNNIRPRPGCVEILDLCKLKNIKLGFITTTTKATLETIKRGLREFINFDYFDLITTKEQVKYQKPHNEVYNYALNTLKLYSKNTCAVEDTAVNQQAALQCGIKCFLFPGEYAIFDSTITKDKNLLVRDLSKLNFSN